MYTPTHWFRRKEWNRINAKKSRQRKKFVVNSMVARAEEIARENAAMMEFIKANNLESKWQSNAEHDKKPLIPTGGPGSGGTSGLHIATPAMPMGTHVADSSEDDRSTSASPASTVASTAIPSVNSGVAEVVRGRTVKLLPDPLLRTQLPNTPSPGKTT
jgi:hypothetical protein